MAASASINSTTLPVMLGIDHFKKVNDTQPMMVTGQIQTVVVRSSVSNNKPVAADPNEKKNAVGRKLDRRQCQKLAGRCAARTKAMNPPPRKTCLFEA
jgi:4'-phosphopantetheinyl transferase EntD